MRNRLSIFLLLVAFAICAHAETIVLRTGARVKGTIVFQNDVVVIVRDTEGARFQYPRTDVADILSDDAAQPEVQETQAAEEEEIQTKKKVSALLEVAGGSAYVPGIGSGASMGVDLIVGSHHIGSRHLLIGGGLGYHGMFMPGEAKPYSFMPVQVALRMPLTEQKHAPAFGVTLGYGIALNKNYSGGIYTGLDFGYRCQVNKKTAIGAMFFAQFQQAKLKVTETVDGVEFVNETGRNFITYGAKFTLYF
jgi:hypothetical protein